MNDPLLTREQLLGCWKVLNPSTAYIELREDGTARKMLVSKSTVGELDLEITWRLIEPSNLELIYRRHGEADPYIVTEYRAKYFKGKTLEWWDIRFNDRLIENFTHTEPICWKRTKPPKNWQNQ